MMPPMTTNLAAAVEKLARRESVQALAADDLESLGPVTQRVEPECRGSSVAGAPSVCVARLLLP
jgi:hypothetical protein